MSATHIGMCEKPGSTFAPGIGMLSHFVESRPRRSITVSKSYLFANFEYAILVYVLSFFRGVSPQVYSYILYQNLPVLKWLIAKSTICLDNKIFFVQLISKLLTDTFFN